MAGVKRHHNLENFHTMATTIIQAFEVTVIDLTKWVCSLPGRIVRAGVDVALALPRRILRVAVVVTETVKDPLVDAFDRGTVALAIVGLQFSKRVNSFFERRGLNWLGIDERLVDLIRRFAESESALQQLRTEILDASMRKPRVDASVARGLFRDMPPTRFGEDPNHTHGASASRRSANLRRLNNYARVNGLMALGSNPNLAQSADQNPSGGWLRRGQASEYWPRM